ncbi:uncharacterized protein LOC131303221 [Rhododendron vialii]|uniref:uncharacterized protein LOC131303221 n=1 Tax=Rhododendron vialii TaxID=182163 RepID=UPI00265E43E7|nr:uncharacterized protein LOC131303221 [Rhododendron vialii]
MGYKNQNATCPHYACPGLHWNSVLILPQSREREICHHFSFSFSHLLLHPYFSILAGHHQLPFPPRLSTETARKIPVLNSHVTAPFHLHFSSQNQPHFSHKSVQKSATVQPQNSPKTAPNRSRRNSIAVQSTPKLHRRSRCSPLQLPDRDLREMSDVDPSKPWAWSWHMFDHDVLPKIFGQTTEHGQCGCCSIVATSAAWSAAWAIKTARPPLELAVQELINEVPKHYRDEMTVNENDLRASAYTSTSFMYIKSSCTANSRGGLAVLIAHAAEQAADVATIEQQPHCPCSVVKKSKVQYLSTTREDRD